MSKDLLNIELTDYRRRLISGILDSLEIDVYFALRGAETDQEKICLGEIEKELQTIRVSERRLISLVTGYQFASGCKEFEKFLNPWGEPEVEE